MSPLSLKNETLERKRHAMRNKNVHSPEWDLHPDQGHFLRVVYIGLLLSLSRAMLLVCGFKNTAKIWKLLTRGPTPRASLQPKEVEALAYEVALAAAMIPARILCLERSIVLFHQIRRRGASATLVLGARARPFEAHAWVALDGVPVDEDPDKLKEFRPIYEVS